MAINILLDTNIVMDLFDADRVAHSASLKKVHDYLVSGATLYVNSDTLTASFYLLKNVKKTTLDEALYAIKETMEICELIPIEVEDVKAALSLCENKNTAYKDYEDALQYVCAKKVDAKAIVTNDKGFVSKDIEIVRVR